MQVNLEFVYNLTKDKVDAMLQAMRDGTFAVPALPQSAFPGPNWHVSQDGKKSAGAQDVAYPNDPGGLGDRSGVRMIERLTRRPQPVDARPTNERLIADGAARLAGAAAESEH